jgi:hypothetical protein
MDWRIGLHPGVSLIHDLDLVILKGHKSKVIAFRNCDGLVKAKALRSRT